MNISIVNNCDINMIIFNAVIPLSSHQIKTNALSHTFIFFSSLIPFFSKLMHRMHSTLNLTSHHVHPVASNFLKIQTVKKDPKKKEEKKLNK